MIFLKTEVNHQVITPSEKLLKARDKIVEVDILVEQAETIIAKANREISEAIELIDKEIAQLKSRIEGLESLRKSAEEDMEFNLKLYEKVINVYNLSNKLDKEGSE